MKREEGIVALCGSYRSQSGGYAIRKQMFFQTLELHSLMDILNCFGLKMVFCTWALLLGLRESTFAAEHVA